MIIYKYRLQIDDIQEIEIPRTFNFLSVQIQDGFITAWYVIRDIRATKIKTTLQIAPTGQEFDLEMEQNNDYLGTVQLNDFVWHIFGVKYN